MEQLENKPLTPQQPRQLPMPKAAWLLLGTLCIGYGFAFILLDNWSVQQDKRKSISNGQLV